MVVILGYRVGCVAGSGVVVQLCTWHETEGKRSRGVLLQDFLLKTLTMLHFFGSRSGSCSIALEGRSLGAKA
jgi:hypothetical protein